jgi:hypothetical protein
LTLQDTLIAGTSAEIAAHPQSRCAFALLALQPSIKQSQAVMICFSFILLNVSQVVTLSLYILEGRPQRPF